MAKSQDRRKETKKPSKKQKERDAKKLAKQQGQPKVIRPETTRPE